MEGGAEIVRRGADVVKVTGVCQGAGAPPEAITLMTMIHLKTKQVY